MKSSSLTSAGGAWRFGITHPSERFHRSTLCGPG
jgi:hypothetical protein